MQPFVLRAFQHPGGARNFLSRCSNSSFLLPMLGSQRLNGLNAGFSCRDPSRGGMGDGHAAEVARRRPSRRLVIPAGYASLRRLLLYKPRRPAFEICATVAHPAVTRLRYSCPHRPTSSSNRVANLQTRALRPTAELRRTELERLRSDDASWKNGGKNVQHLLLSIMTTIMLSLVRRHANPQR